MYVFLMDNALCTKGKIIINKRHGVHAILNFIIEGSNIENRLVIIFRIFYLMGWLY